MPGQSWVEWGATPSLGRRTGTAQDIAASSISIFAEYQELYPAANPESVIHHARIDGLAPGNRYYYRVVTEGIVFGEVHSFRTSPEPGEDSDFRFAVWADTQGSGDQHSKVVNAVIERVGGLAGDEISDELAMVWVVGDTVETGVDYDGFKADFFDPIRPLASQVPVYTVPGNHEYADYVESPLRYILNERYAETYFAYADLPGDEHNYSFDYANCHFVALDTNGPLWDECTYGSGKEEQLAWLEADLREASADPDIDFIFAFHHQPLKTELWNDVGGGWTPCVGPLIDLYERYGVNAFFHGHTHAMERGNSREAPLYWIDSSGGGAPLEKWISSNTKDGDAFDWPEIQKAMDEHGFHLVSVRSGDAPSFEIEYVGLGDLHAQPEPAERIDRFVFLQGDAPPDKPVCLYPLGADTPSGGPVVFRASAFSDPDAEEHHHETQWQVTTVSGEYPPTGSDTLYPPKLAPPTPPVVADRWVRYENLFAETPDGVPIDTQAGDDLTDEVITLDPITTYYWRVRYRDGLGLKWSEWSEEVAFTTGTD